MRLISRRGVTEVLSAVVSNPSGLLVIKGAKCLPASNWLSNEDLLYLRENATSNAQLKPL